MRKMLALAMVAFLAVTFALALFGCGKKEESSTTTGGTETTTPSTMTTDTSTMMHDTTMMDTTMHK